MNQTCTIIAQDRRDLSALQSARRWLEAGVDQVRVEFRAGDPAAVFTRADLPAIYRKITYSM